MIRKNFTDSSDFSAGEPGRNGNSMTKRPKTTKKDTGFLKIRTVFRRAGKISLLTALKILKNARPDEITVEPGSKTITFRYTREF